MNRSEDRERIRWVNGPEEIDWDIEVDVLVIGAGGCGLVGALAAAEQGANVMIVEKEAKAGGNTALSQGMVPAAGSALQRAAGIDDSPEIMAEDILKKNHFESDREMTCQVAGESSRLVDWLTDRMGLRFQLVTNFLYPGHSRHRIHAPSTTKGVQLVNQLLEAVRKFDRVDLAYGAPAKRLVVRNTDQAVLGAEIEIKGVGLNLARSKKTILALNGFGANKDMVARYIPEMKDAYYFGHEGNTGEGILWGRALGAALENMGAYQAHGSVAHPSGTLLTWAAMSLGGYQVDTGGRRFVNEDHGYSEHALDVITLETGTAVEIFDRRIYDEIKDFEDFRLCLEMGAVKEYASIEELSEGFGIDPAVLSETHRAYQKAARGEAADALGRTNIPGPLVPPLYGVRVTGALFHTQGGLKVDSEARVIRPDGSPIPHLYAGGGTAVGLSGRGVYGYLSANGLLAALVLGMIAGENAGRAALADTVSAVIQ